MPVPKKPVEGEVAPAFTAKRDGGETLGREIDVWPHVYGHRARNVSN